MRIVKERFSVLEAGYIIFLLKPYYRNFSKRFVKAPKLYFYDTGLLCYLLRLKEEDLLLSPYKEALFESLIISECRNTIRTILRDWTFTFGKVAKELKWIFFLKPNKKYVL